MREYTVRIGGRHVATDECIEVRSPYSGEVVGSVPLCAEAQVEEACAAAEAALRRDNFKQSQRARVLERVCDLLAGDGERFAQLIAAEAGKPITAARVELRRCIETLRFSAVEARNLAGDVVPVEASEFGGGKVMLALPKPIGVIAAITPFNFPLNLVAHKLGPAIAAGCPVVLKPAPQAPLCAIELVEVLIEAGLPGDWVSVVTDDGTEAGIPLVRHHVPRMITFTGSSAVGWQIADQSPRKRVALELGSTAPVIIEPDVDLKLVAERVAAAGFGYSGQSCISVQHVLVHQSIADELTEFLRIEAEALRTGDPLDPVTDVGPLIDEGATERVLAWVEEAVGLGATLLTGGGLDGPVLRPTVVVDAPRTATLCREEVFGPVLVVAAYRDFEEAVALANDTELSLQAGVFTNDLGKALAVARALEFGGVNINDVPSFRADPQPYGGVGAAGNTREGPRYAVREMTELRVVSLSA